MEQLNAYIDHTILAPDACRDAVLQAADAAIAYKAAALCINPCWIPLAKERLAGTGVKTAAVIGFPLGATLPAVKAFEAAEAVRLGAEELDMVINIGFVKSGDWDAVMRDMEGVVKAAAGKAKVKVIIETCLLTDAEKVLACEIAQAACADYIKTSTGFSTGGATEDDVRLMRETVGPRMGVKASGGIRTREQAEKMIAAGASRLGCSATKKILEG